MAISAILERLRAFVRRGLPSQSPAAFVFALVCVAVATLARWSIDFVVPNAVPFATYFPAILVIALIAGAWAAALASILSAIISIWMFVPPRFQFDNASPDDLVNLALFFIAAATIIWIAMLYRRMVRQLAEEESYRQVVVDELGHRVKNKLATVYAILRHELRGHREIWDSVAGRLRALSAADDFLLRSEGRGFAIREILELELKPYGSAMVTLDGHDVLVQDKVAVILALLFHELATNAAKYGALSTLNGGVAVTWREERDVIALEWREHGGPPVTPPKQRSFGSKLIERSLDGFGGWARLEFAADGVVCRMSLPRSHAGAENSESVVV
jgi:two-component sensor histidine kinase